MRLHGGIPVASSGMCYAAKHQRQSFAIINNCCDDDEVLNTNTMATDIYAFAMVCYVIRHKSNIPLVAVAGVMDGLLGKEGASEGSGSIAQSDVRPGADNPPDYDYDFV
jgi:hypothetical protein